MKPIVCAPHAVLSKPAETITDFGKPLARLVKEMTQTLLSARNPKGVGLAAPQIGQSSRVFVTKHHPDAPVKVLINPEIIESSTELVEGIPGSAKRLEGCLSIPKIWGKVNRAKRVRLKYQDAKGTWHEETFRGFEAVIIQHETDHVNGILYTQRVLEQKGKLYQATKDKEGKEVLEEIPIT